jgi:hypothetical protein
MLIKNIKIRKLFYIPSHCKIDSLFKLPAQFNDPSFHQDNYAACEDKQGM